MTDGKKIATYSLGPEARGEIPYADTAIASYLKYTCAYCMDKFYLVDPYSQRSGGAIQRELAKHKDTGQVLAVLRTFGICVGCFHAIIQRQQQDKS